MVSIGAIRDKNRLDPRYTWLGFCEFTVMHYVPESACELLRADPVRAAAGGSRWEFHYQSAPLYVLTCLVGSLLLADVLLDSAWFAEWASWRSVWGYRLALWAAVLGGARILYHTLDGLASGRVGADLALTVACLAAIVLGEHQTAGFVVLISLIGESLEGYTLDRARCAMREAFSRQPAIAHLVGDQEERDVPVAELQVGDTVAVRPGERLPVDGRVVAGQSTVDESTFTGESVPIFKGPDDFVFAGTLNHHGSLLVRAERVSADTVVARIADLVGQAAARKAEWERLADRLARWFLPAVLAAAAATLIGWRVTAGTWQSGWLPALAVLVIACPCPLILATPCAVMAVLARLARRGLVVKGSAALERLSFVDTFAFDKTGTLTQGALALGDVVPLATDQQIGDTAVPETLTTDDVLRLAAIAERRSEHVLARELVRAAEARFGILPAPFEFTARPGGGVIARIRSTALSWSRSAQEVSEPWTVTLVVGNRRLLEEQSITVPAQSERLAEELADQGQTTFFVAVDGRVRGVIGLRDTLRPETRAVFDALRRLGIERFALLTGDRPQRTEAVIRLLGNFDHVATELTPETKAAWLREQQAQGRHVAMVGDGVNDAPALAAADVGLAVVRPGSDLAAEAGDVLLMGEPLRALPDLLRMSRALVRNIQQSITWFAFGANGLGVLASSLGWLDPVAAALCHELASLGVMINALRLLWLRLPGVAVESPAAPGREVMQLVLEWLSPSRWVYAGLRNWQVCVQLLLATALLLWSTSQVVWLRPDEHAVVLRFGKRHTVLEAGWHWRWPWPFERLVRERPAQLRRVTLGFRPVAESVERTGVIEWTSEHRGEQEAAESLFLTADEVLLEITAELQYQIHDVSAFHLSGPAAVEELLRRQLEAVVRELSARHGLDEWLGEQRVAYEEQAQRMLRDRLERLGLGIELVDLQLLDVHPPVPVVAEYRRAADALEELEQQRNEAQLAANRVLLSAMGEAAWLQVPPGEPLTEETWRSLLSRDARDKLLLSGESAAVLEQAAADAVAVREAAVSRAEHLQLLAPLMAAAPELTWSAVYWSRLLPALVGRPITVVDPRAVRRQHWWWLERNDALSPNFWNWPAPPSSPRPGAPEPPR